MKAWCVEMFCASVVDSGCRHSLLSVPQGVSSAWGGRFLCSLAISPPPHVLPPPWLPKPLHYSSSHYPHSQPLTDECASRQNILLYYILLLWSPPTTSSNMLREIHTESIWRREQLFFFFVYRVWVEAKLSDSLQKIKVEADHSEMLNISELQAWDQ